MMIITLTKLYRIDGVTFEWNERYGPSIINRHTEEERPYRNVSGRNWGAIRKFTNMTLEQRELFRL